MSNPQQPELGRSRKTPSQSPDSMATVLQGEPDLGAESPRGPVPPENQPGHHPQKEQDKPDPQAFAERLGVTPAEGNAGTESPTRAASSSPDYGTPTRARRMSPVAMIGILALTFRFIRRRRRRQRA